jgi:hypothetical protein
MRLSEWRKAAPSKESMSNRVAATLEPVLVDLGADADAECWVCWGDDPEMRYSILAPTVAGLATVAVRLSGPDNVRAMAKLIRWSKVSVSELDIDASDGHRIVAVQVENQVLKGVDEEADRICEFVRGLVAAIENRNPQPIPVAVMERLGAAAASSAPPAGQTGPDKAVDGEAAAPKALAVSKSAPATTRVAARPAPKPVPEPVVKPAELVSMPVPSPEPPAVPELPAPDPDVQAKPFAPTPIAVRAAGAQKGGQSSAGPSVPAAGQPGEGADHPASVGPHPIEHTPVNEPDRPRRWTP